MSISPSMLQRATWGELRTVLMFAHPDDEAVALGARLELFAAATLVHVTDGAPRNGEDARMHGFASVDAYRAARAEELNAALKRAGLRKMKRVALQIPDQEASLHLPEITGSLCEILQAETPDVVFTHPYEGGHPDHDATAFAVHRAAARWGTAGGKAPRIVEAAFYHLGSKGIETGRFLGSQQETEAIHFDLSPVERERKQEILACFPSQQGTLRLFPLDRESYRIAPEYDFHAPPHERPVLYENFPWGMTSSRFCELTQAADERAMHSCR
ncbi:PIG-L family deacetylase [Acidobacteria bacterium AB60]|nr:PIG-L family deacetylase [Acidobacteria bacterium AB60]